MAFENESCVNAETGTLKARLKGLDWQKVAGLMPTVVQDHLTGRVLMVAMMSEESLDKTLDSGLVTFFSRSRQRLWTKGETSGHYLQVKEIKADCDGDCLLVSAVALGPTCHTGAESCFDGAGDRQDGETSGVLVLNKLWRTIEDRAKESPPLASVDGGLASEGTVKASYTTRLLGEGVARCAQKVGEEGVEVALAGVSRDREGLVSEAADLVYHLFVLLKARGLRPEDVWGELGRRHRPTAKA